MKVVLINGQNHKGSSYHIGKMLVEQFPESEISEFFLPKDLEHFCVGCYTCILSCPYGAIMPAENGVVQKCELCIENSCGTPACVAGCPNNAIIFAEEAGA